MKLLLVHPDDPAKEMTWSRTPFFLTKAFASAKTTVLHFKTGPDSILAFLLLRLVQFFTGLDYHYSFLFRKIAARRLKRALHYYNPDAVLHLGPSSAMTFLDTNVPNFLYCDDTWNILNTRGKEFLYPQPSKALFERINRYTSLDYRKFKAIFTQTTEVKNDLISHYHVPEDKIIVVGVGLGYVQSSLVDKPYSKPQILFVARNSFKRKGGELLLDAFKIVRSVIPDATLVLEGGGAPKFKDMEGVIVNGLSDRVALQKLYEESFLLAMPSLSEPFGLVYIEALANNTAILGLNRGALPDITQNGRFGFLVDLPDPNEIAKLLIDILSNKEAVKARTALGRDFIMKEYNWDTVVTKMKTVISEVKNK